VVRAAHVRHAGDEGHLPELGDAREAVQNVPVPTGQVRVVVLHDVEVTAGAALEGRIERSGGIVAFHA
jgi:hypothetical protein